MQPIVGSEDHAERQGVQVREGRGQRLLVTGAETRDRRVAGTRFAVITRKATSSRQRRSIPRLERSPTAYARTTTAPPSSPARTQRDPSGSATRGACGGRSSYVRRPRGRSGGRRALA